MTWFNNMKIMPRLIASFAAIALIAGIIGYIGIYNINEVNHDYTDLYENYGIALGDIGEADIHYQMIRISLRDIMLHNDTAAREKYSEAIKTFEANFKLNLTNFEKSIQSDEVLDEFNVFKLAADNYLQVKNKIVSLALSGEEQQALLLLQGEGAEYAAAIDISLDKLISYKVTGGREKVDEYENTTNNTIMVMVIVIVLAMLIALGLGILIAKSISAPLKKLIEAANRLAVGDVGSEIGAVRKDEVGALMESFREMILNIREQSSAAEKIASGDMTVEVRIKSDNDILGKNLSEMIKTNNEVLSQINAASEQVAAGSRQVSASGQLLSQSSTEQASSIEETTATIEEIASRTKQNTQNANYANGLALDAKQNAVRGNEKMGEMLRSMKDINESSSKVSKIIKVIDEIAFQTNILALNAAVEAARAGMHGKGFAVVAEEVRNLAAKSADAARETTDMIEGSISKVEAGMQIADQTAEALKKITEGSEKVAELVGGIAVASEEQDVAINQISQAISQISQAVQTNSSTAEESAAASEELSSQSELLKDLVSRFKLAKTHLTDKYKASEPSLRHKVYNSLNSLDFGKY